MLIETKHFPFSLFARQPSLHIISEFREAVSSMHLSSLMAIGLLLFVISMLVNMPGVWMGKHRNERVRRVINEMRKIEEKHYMEADQKLLLCLLWLHLARCLLLPHL